MVNILLEAVTREPLFRRVPNFARLCLATRGNFLVQEKGKKFCVIQICHKNCLFSEKSHKFTLGTTRHVPFSAAPDGETSSFTWSCLTHVVMYLGGLEISGSFLDLTQ